MAELPFTSVIVPVRNGQATIAACIESLLALDYPRDRIELLPVDNASTDATQGILRSFGRAVRVVREPRRGAAAARNAGLRAATGDVVAFTDADCVVDSGWLRSLVAPLAGRPDRVVGGAILANPAANPIERFGELVHGQRASIEVYRPPYVTGMNFAASRSGPVGQERFDEAFRRCQDVDLSFRLFQAGCSFVFEPDAVVYHRNERTLPGLFREGLQHGFYSVQARKKHRALLRAYGDPVCHWGTYADIAAELPGAVLGRDRSRCEVMFLSGKALGRLGGSIRFRHLCL